MAGLAGLAGALRLRHIPERLTCNKDLPGSRQQLNRVRQHLQMEATDTQAEAHMQTRKMLQEVQIEVTGRLRVAQESHGRHSKVARGRNEDHRKWASRIRPDGVGKNTSFIARAFPNGVREYSRLSHGSARPPASIRTPRYSARGFRLQQDAKFKILVREMNFRLIFATPISPYA